MQRAEGAELPATTATGAVPNQQDRLAEYLRDLELKGSEPIEETGTGTGA